MKSRSVTIQMKATEQYFPVVLYIMLYKAVLTLESVDEIQKCDPSIESFSAVLSFCKLRFSIFCLVLILGTLDSESTTPIGIMQLGNIPFGMSSEFVTKNSNSVDRSTAMKVLL